MNQRTLKNPIRAMGIGVHTGEKVFLTLKPALEDTGIVFRRVDLDPVIEIRAAVSSVGDTRLSTTLMKEGIRISTVEHLMSAMAGLGIDNAIVEVSASELPIMDGSSGPFVFLLQSAGFLEQKKPKRFLRIKKAVKVKKGDSWAKLEPYEGFKISVRLDYEHPVFNRTPQNLSLDLSTISYVKELSRARTFGFMADYEFLRANHLAVGASLDNTVVLDDYRVINEDGLRYQDEFARHKALDVVGDLYLCGYSVIGAFSGYKPGHCLNNKLLSALLADQKAWEIITFEKPCELPTKLPGFLPVAV